MAAYVSCPAVALPEHQVPTNAVLADIARAQEGQPGLSAALRIVKSLRVDHRFWSLPLEELTLPQGIEARNRWTVEAVYQLGAQAARDALRAARLDAGEVDCLIPVHSSGIAMPGLGVHLARVLGLRPDVLHVPVTQVGCTGGSWGLALAAQLVAAQPGRRVLLVVSEALSSCYRPAEPGIVSAMYSGLFGDCGAAAVVTSDWRAPGLRIDDWWTYLLPDSSTCYWMEPDVEGQRFASTPAALRAVTACMPDLVERLKAVPQSAWPVWMAAHPGGPRIIESQAAGLPDAPDLAHAWESLREHGNPGGPAVLDVLRRHYADPPAHGAPGLVAGFGPGFFGAAVYGAWMEHAEN
ncbi:putative polyketide synthase (plasmid) [Actinacidiphila reveromycinica]|uniref:Alkyldihydropyron synthase n=1 Tax=Actinacidiphila reveromycinica TaxID=659352 RepID=A0A0B6VK26_9ACTN|nr:PhlD [Streptomyces sp. SN-593]BAQ19510.1 alkyldihydropyron synthase [Streptomyces sp. SN-593]BBG20755.1 putative polyketide synthase [Streptomyces sp. SN-593]